MWYWVGIILLISGGLSLIFNEFTVRIRRIWPWRRDESDPTRDAELNEFYRLMVYLGSIGSIEFGALLAAVALPHIALRIAAYFCFGAWLLFRRPAMREREFWLALPFRGRKPRPRY